ncbi:MAG: hypothetical protein PHT91_00070 [Candidatus Nanoarchaeia archaeon]|nr:hypothetical protein [Candidatus Nanoarchaeia archaeon]MDD5054142.1 hypothetical protein [Candidatus Nanoarchaeia archaeon]MDD5499257.1 hypothetical protein [Candidatus Nanoarchaeia archaeon]
METGINQAVNREKDESLISSFERIKNELERVTFPLKKILNIEINEKTALIRRIDELVIEVERMLSSINEEKNEELFKKFIKRAEEIIEEKEKISAQLEKFKRGK